MVTLVDIADLHERTCPVCGVVVGDMLRHRRWHRDDDRIRDFTVETLRPLVDEYEERRQAASSEVT